MCRWQPEEWRQSEVPPLKRQATIKAEPKAMAMVKVHGQEKGDHRTMLRWSRVQIVKSILIDTAREDDTARGSM